MPEWDPEARVGLRPGVGLAPADGGRWQLRWDFDEVAFLEGESWPAILPWLAPLLATGATHARIAAACPPPLRGRLEEALAALAQRGFLQIGNEAPDVTQDDAHRARLARTRVAVCGRSPLAQRTADAIAEHGIAATVADSLAPLGAAANGPLPVVVETDWSEQELLDANAAAQDARRTWMILGAWNRRVLVGPVFVPTETACYSCYRRRLDSHRRHLEAFRRFSEASAVGGPAAPSEPVLPALTALAAGWCALEVFDRLAGARPGRLAGRVLVYDPDTHRLAIETVLRLPWCAPCAGASGGRP